MQQRCVITKVMGSSSQRGTGGGEPQRHRLQPPDHAEGEKLKFLGEERTLDVGQAREELLAGDSRLDPSSATANALLVADGLVLGSRAEECRRG